jgi:predicted naringenin-chalcone synthase
MSDARAECFIESVVTAVPDQFMDQGTGCSVLAPACTDPRTVRLMQRVIRLTGVERRYLAALDHQPPDREAERLYRPASVQPAGPGMGARTAAFRTSAGPLVLKAISQLPAGLLESVQTLVTVTCTHASSPGLEEVVLAQTPVPATVDRWNLGFMGCSGGLAGLRLVHQTAPQQRRALVIACELSSLHCQYSDRLDQMTANLLFSDGAAAVALTPQRTPVRIVDCRCLALPRYADQMVWLAGDHGLHLRLSRDLPDTLAAHLPGFVNSFLADHGAPPASVDHWLVHPGGPQILDAVESSLGLPGGAVELSRGVLRRYGNMSSPTIFFILRELLAGGGSGRTLAMAFGPGLTIELALLEIAQH